MSDVYAEVPHGKRTVQVSILLEAGRLTGNGTEFWVDTHEDTASDSGLRIICSTVGVEASCTMWAKLVAGVDTM